MPTKKSILVDLVRRYTRMQVLEVEDGMRAQILQSKQGDHDESAG